MVYILFIYDLIWISIKKVNRFLIVIMKESIWFKNIVKDGNLSYSLLLSVVKVRNLNLKIDCVVRRAISRIKLLNLLKWKNDVTWTWVNNFHILSYINSIVIHEEQTIGKCNNFIICRCFKLNLGDYFIHIVITITWTSL